MLLFIVGGEIVINSLKYFNTSHVTVYPDSLINAVESFIFQYISCYCLSFRSTGRVLWLYISIHLMLLFIGNTKVKTASTGRISIHLMLLFIVGGEIVINSLKYFNTSHVTVYQTAT